VESHCNCQELNDDSKDGGLTAVGARKINRIAPSRALVAPQSSRSTQIDTIKN